MDHIPRRPDGTTTRLPTRLHHHAYTTNDHEITRHFYEDVIGMPLVAMYIERELLDGEWVDLGHAFYGLGDGSAVAFFNFADPAKQTLWRAKEQSLFTHLSLKVDLLTPDAIRGRLDAEGLDVSTSRTATAPRYMFVILLVCSWSLRSTPVTSKRLLNIWRRLRTPTFAGG